jgi:predicted DNA-binding transcriptional regulator AlpA
MMSHVETPGVADTPHRNLPSPKYGVEPYRLLEQPGQTPTREPDWVGLNRAHSLPATGFVRLCDIVGKPATKTSPAIAPIIPVSRSTWWAGVRSGRFPQPTRKLGARITAWSVESIHALIENSSTGGA